VGWGKEKASTIAVIENIASYVVESGTEDSDRRRILVRGSQLGKSMVDHAVEQLSSPVLVTDSIAHH
jgi:hypothetical protein